MSHIVIIDDELHISEQIEAVLEDTSMDCLPVLDPRNLFDNLNYQTPDLILLDIHMPGINGMEILRQLKAHPQHHEIPVIMITGDTDYSLLAACFETGAVDFLRKPLDAVELKARIGSVLRSRKYQHLLEAEIRERKQAQAQLVQTAKLASLGSIGTGVAHEINNPLAVIQYSLEELREHLKAGETGALNETLKLIGKQVARAARVTNHLRSFAREIDAHKTRDIPPQKLVRDVSLILAESLKKDNIQWEITCADDLPLVAGIPILLQDVLLALMRNARDAVIDSQGKRIFLRVFAEDGHVVWEVEDTGQGIPEDVVPRIFDPFFTTKPVGSGAGLGLSAAYGIIAEHRGRLRLARTSSRGCVFQMGLPVTG